MGILFRGAPAWRPGTRWPWYLAVVAATILFLGSQALAAALALRLWSLSEAMGHGPGGTGVASEFAMRLLGLSQAFVVLITILIAAVPAGRPAVQLRLHAPAGGWRSYVAAVGAMIPVLLLINALAWTLGPEAVRRDFELISALAKSPDPLAPALAICVGAPLSEELLFRGFLLTALGSTRLGFWPAGVFVSVAWTLLHWGYSIVGLAEVFTIGLFFSWLLWRTGSLRVPLFCHALYNTALFLALRHFVD